MAQDSAATPVAATPQEGLVVTPYVSLSTLYDDNIYSSSSQIESDTILRLSPGIVVGYRSDRSTFDFSYSFDSERYSRHSDLNSWDARQSALVDGSYSFTDKFTAALSASYLDTYYPGELAPITGVELARTRSTQVSLRPTATYQFNSRTKAVVFYDRTREHVSGGFTSFTTIASAALVRDLTRRDQLTFGYQTYWYNFSSGTTSPQSRVFTIGWEHALSRQASLFITAGPRNTSGHTKADIYAGIRRDSENTSQAVYYTRTQLTLAGETGLYDTQGVEASFGFRPAMRWSIDIYPGYYRITQGSQAVSAYSMGLAARFWFARDWSLAFSNNYNHQLGNVGTSSNDSVIRRNVVALTLTWALPSGPGHATLPARAGYGISPMGNGG